MTQRYFIDEEKAAVIRRLLLVICAHLPIPPAEINAALREEEENTEENTDTTPVIN